MENKQKLNTIENKTEPLVSVIMPVYNTEKYLCEAIDSILVQTVSDFELILVEDCSTDSTRSIVEAYAGKDSRIVAVYNESNLGLVSSLNKAIAITKGKYIARMDGDDISMSDRFEKQIGYLEDNGLDIVGCQCILFSDGINSGKNLDYPTSDDICRRFLRHSNALAHPAWVGKKEVFTALEYRNIVATEDYDFMIRAVMAGYKIGNAPTRCFCYRINDNGISVSNSAVQNVMARYLARQYRKNEIVCVNQLEVYKHSNSFKESVRREQYNLSRLDRARSKGKIFRILMTMANCMWIRNRLIRTVNTILVKVDSLQR